MKTLKPSAKAANATRTAAPTDKSDKTGKSATPEPQQELAKALGKRQQVVLLAEELSRAADVLHRRLTAELKKGVIEQVDAQSLLEDEALLRERANSVLLDAADYVIEDLPLTQEKLMLTVAKAQARIEKLEHITMIVDLAADLSLLASALLTAKTAPFLTALKKLKADSAVLDKIK